MTDRPTDAAGTHATAKPAGQDMWGGRFSSKPADIMQAINVSIGVDRRLWAHDLAGSRAHARALHTAGLLDDATHAELQRGLDELEAVFASLRPRERTMDLFLEPSEDELANLDISGYAADALQELLDNRDDPVARDAANLLFRLEG